MSNLPQPPEGVLDPQIPWSRINPNSRLWVILKARLTGRPQDGENYSSYVNISEADADRLIANMKKDPRGYPSLDQASGNPIQWMENQRLYQEWLVEAYLENPFREETNKKIEDAAIQSRLNEIQEEKRKKKVEPIQEDETKEDETEIQEQVTEITEELDKESTKEKEESTKEESTEEKPNPNLLNIEDSLKNIKSSLSSQASIVGAINNTNEGSIRTLGIIQDIFLAQTDLLRKKDELKEINKLETTLEKGSKLSGSSKAVSTMDDGSAEAEVVQVDGDILTIKPIEGNFKEGQRISTGGGGFDLLGMIKSIAGRFGGGKGAPAAGSPTKMSKGGIALGPKKLANGGFQPGLYTKPTVGNLAPGQAVIPLNRNVGKNIVGGKNKTKIEKNYQPLANVMQQPIKAIGSAIIAMAGNVVRSMGALAGFFTPYITPILNSLGRALGVPVSIIESLLGGPAYAATTDLKQQTNIFADIWSGLMDVFGLSFGKSGKDKKKNNKRKKPPSTATGKWGPLLDVIASGEGNYTSVNPGLQRPEILDKTISELVAWQYQSKAKDGGTAASGRYQMVNPESYAQNAGLSMDEKFTPENQDKMAAAYIEKIRGGNDWLAGKITDEDFGKELAKEWAALEYPGKGGGFYDGDGRNKAKVSWDKVKDVLPQVKAESGANVSQGKAIDAFTLTGPNSGYQVPGIGEMHGKEAVIQYQKGFTVLPIENRLFSMEKDPLNTISRWQQLLGSSISGSSGESYASGGKVTLYAGHADMTSDAPGGKGTNGGPKGDAAKIAAASGYFTNEAYLNDKIAAAAASKSGGVAEYRSPIRTKNGTDSNSNWTRAKNDVAAGNTPIEIHHDAESGKAGLITKDQNILSSNKFLKSVNSSFGFYRTGDEGFVKRGGAILEMDALKPHMRTNPSAWISSASTKLANALKQNASTTSDDTTNDDSGGGGSAPEEEQQSTDPIKNIENALKSMAVGFAITKGFETGEITDDASYKRVRDAATASASSISSASSTSSPASTPTPPIKIITNQSGERIAMSGSGSSARPVGKVLSDMCVPNFG